MKTGRHTETLRGPIQKETHYEVPEIQTSGMSKTGTVPFDDSVSSGGVRTELVDHSGSCRSRTHFSGRTLSFENREC